RAPRPARSSDRSAAFDPPCSIANEDPVPPAAPSALSILPTFAQFHGAVRPAPHPALPVPHRSETRLPAPIRALPLTPSVAQGRSASSSPTRSRDFVLSDSSISPDSRRAERSLLRAATTRIDPTTGKTWLFPFDRFQNDLPGASRTYAPFPLL